MCRRIIPLTRTARRTNMEEREFLMLARIFFSFFFLGHFFSIITFANVLNKFGSISLAELPLIRLLFFIQSDILNSECPQFWFNIRNIIGNSEHCYSPAPETETLKDKIYQIMIVKIMIFLKIFIRAFLHLSYLSPTRS